MTQPEAWNLLATPARRKVLFATLYVSEGAPIGFLWIALPTQLKAAGVTVEEITAFTSLLVLPWIFKFLWAPMIDVCQGTYWTLRHWIIAAQTLMGLTLLPLAWGDLASQFRLWMPLLLAHAFCAATQDVAIDALCIRSTEPAERGRLNGWMQAGMLLGRSLLGGGALVLASLLGDGAVVALLVVTIWCTMGLVIQAREPLKSPSIEGQSKRLAQFFAARQRSDAPGWDWPSR